MKTIYQMNVMELIHNKDQILFDLNQVQHTYLEKETEILLTTDFKELKLTNEKMRTAYINKQLGNLKFQIEAYKNSLTIINDLIKLRLIEMEVKSE